jgi:uracil-DNA glycosylase family 4
MQAATVTETATVEIPRRAEAESAAAFLSRLSAVASICPRCRLCEGRKRVVFGAGDSAAQLMFVGEGPGAEEDRQGLPFVGAAGAKLTQMIEAMGLQRSRVYIANVVKCRPPGNRDPMPDEVDACRGYLEAQIDTIRPRAIVALGRIAAHALLGNDEPLNRMRGRWLQVRGVPLRVTYHPAAILRSAEYRKPTWEDLQLVRDRLLSESEET